MGEVYRRNIVLRVTTFAGTTEKRPVMSFDLLTDALTQAAEMEAREREQGLSFGVEVIDLEHLHMGNMREKFKVEGDRLLSIEEGA